MAIDWRELDIHNIQLWPENLKRAVACVLAMLILFLGYYFDISNLLDRYNDLQDEQDKLKTSFEEKQQQAALIDEYRDQMKQMRTRFGTLLKQLPEDTEVPGLVEDVSRQALSSGLELSSIKLQPEQQQDFYAELPMEISVKGGYHQLATFVSNVAALSRIVTLHDFSLDSDPAQLGHDALSMKIVAKTYRYRQEDGEKGGTGHDGAAHDKPTVTGPAPVNPPQDNPIDKQDKK